MYLELTIKQIIMTNTEVDKSRKYRLVRGLNKKNADRQQKRSRVMLTNLAKESTDEKHLGNWSLHECRKQENDLRYQKGLD